MATINLPGQTIGILGKGKMTERLVGAAKERGYEANVFAGKSRGDLLDFAGKANLLVFESDFVDTDELQAIQHYIEIPQLSETLAVTQDRLIEKVFLESLNINVVPYATITSIQDLKDAIGSIGFPCVLKPIRVEANRLSNVLIYSEEDFAKTEYLLKTGTCILDAWVPFEKELAVSFVSGKDGQIEAFPVVETIYHHHELQAVVAPAQIEPEMDDAVVAIGQAITAALAVKDIVTVEFLMTAVGTIYVKRITTGAQLLLDYTMDATNISQYELLIRAVCGLPLPKIKLAQGVVCFLLKSAQQEGLFQHMQAQPDWFLHKLDAGWLVNAIGAEWQTLEQLLTTG